MKAICVTPQRGLELRSVPAPGAPPPGHVLVAMDSAIIAHGDKYFLTRPLPGGGMAGGRHDVYGANGAGRIAATGAGVPPDWSGRKVAIYKSLTRSPETIGLWYEQALVPAASCLALPEAAEMRDYCGSLANIGTVYGFLDEIAAAGHQGVIVTAGTSATGRIAAALARRRGMPAIFLTRSAAGREALLADGAAHVLVTAEDGFVAALTALAAELGTTAVFDGVGGALLGRVLPALPMNALVSIYGFLGGAAQMTFDPMLVMDRNLTIRRFANMECETLRDLDRRRAAFAEIESFVAEPPFRTRIGQTFRFAEIDAAMAYTAADGGRAVLVP
jgi:NADPH2:quinone reductase